MELNNSITKDNNQDNKSIKSNANLKNIKNNYNFCKIIINISRHKKLEIFKYNKKMQNILNLNIKDYKEFSDTFTPIEIEIIPCKNKYSEFINIQIDDRLYYHIYLNNSNKEEKNKYRIEEKDNITKIKIIVDYQVKSFERLFFFL